MAAASWLIWPIVKLFTELFNKNAKITKFYGIVGGRTVSSLNLFANSVDNKIVNNLTQIIY